MLASWNDGAAKSALTGFVARIADPAGGQYVPPAERIAVFDNDGTLWSEYPLPVQALFVADRVRQLAARDASMRDRQPFKAILEHDHEALHALGKQGLAELLFATHTGMSADEFTGIARAWFASAKHPKLGAIPRQVVFKPQIELLGYLREHGFKNYIVSGGGVDFIRAMAEEHYGIPPEQVIGSSAKLRVESAAGGPVLMKAAEAGSFNDREAKVQNIALHIGRRPVLAFGNSDGDLAMLRYVRAGPGARLALLLHHDDADREAAYDRGFKVSPLAEALDQAAAYGIVVVRMKRDWNTVFF